MDARSSDTRTASRGGKWNWNLCTPTRPLRVSCHCGGYLRRKNAESTASDCQRLQRHNDPIVPWCGGAPRSRHWHSTGRGALHRMPMASTTPFPVLLAADVLEHVPLAPLQTLRHMRSLLVSQGRFFVSVPARPWVNDPGHFWPLLPHEWEQVFVASGFRIHRWQMSRLCWYGLPTPLPL